MNPIATLDNPALAPVAEYTRHVTAERYRSYSTPRVPHRQYLAAASVIPGALLLMVVAAIKVPGDSINLVLIAVLGLVLMLVLGGLAYAIVDTAPRVIRTRIAVAIAVAVNIGYLGILGVFVLR